ncbi:hypothetical protein [Nocardia sp. A7]|uniref:hypothetical protein n=1 Tax=Nocardia sp. A7 TaxID=2789274 RepID=UPI0039793358
MNGDLNGPARTPEVPAPAAKEQQTPFVRWPEPSPLHDWWTAIMEGADPRIRPSTLRTVGQRADRLRPA